MEGHNDNAEDIRISAEGDEEGTTARRRGKAGRHGNIVKMVVFMAYIGLIMVACMGMLMVACMGMLMVACVAAREGRSRSLVYWRIGLP